MLKYRLVIEVEEANDVRFEFHYIERLDQAVELYNNLTNNNTNPGFSIKDLEMYKGEWESWRGDKNATIHTLAGIKY